MTILQTSTPCKVLKNKYFIKILGEGVPPQDSR